MRGRRYLRRLANDAVIMTRGQAWSIVNVVEFPKCGGTWLRRLLSSYRDVPSIERNDQLIGSRGVHKRHSLYSPRLSNPVILVRDPRDVYVSYYYHDLRLAAGGRGVMARFSHDPSRPVATDFAAYLSAKLATPDSPGFRHTYADFSRSWQGRSGTLVVRYEDLLQEPRRELRRIAEFSGELWDEDRARAAIDLNTLEATRSRLKSSTQRAHLRAGTAGGWRDIYTPEALDMLMSVEADAFSLWGYA